MTFSAVGTIVQAQASTFSLTPGGVGHIILFEATNLTTTVVASSMSSSNVTWVKLGTSFTGSNNAWSSTVFLGTVTSTSNATVTITWTGGTPTTPQSAGQEFSTTAGASSVTLDVQGHVDLATTNSAWASLTPNHGAGELYFGYCLNNGVASAGSTSGYTYQLDTDSNGMAYNANCTTSAQAPTWADSGQVFGVMVLVYEAATGIGPALNQGLLPNRPAVITTGAGWRGAGHSR